MSIKKHAFRILAPHVLENEKLREPQREGYVHIAKHYSVSSHQRETGIILPVGCGKSGLMTIAPFATKSERTLVIAPNLNIAKQLLNKDFNSSSDELFYRKCAVLEEGTQYPEVAEIRGSASNHTDLDEADVVITNIQQLQGTNNRWLTSLPENYFDLILVDEGHHNVAESWELLRRRFSNAKIINVSATPVRADGQIMEGKIIYSFPVARAMQQGYIKRLKAVVLNPATLKFVREENGVEIEVSRDEVVKLGENDTEFRRSILTSKETLDTIVDCSIQQLRTLRKETGDERHKIIASALNYHHCIQIVEAYTARGFRADYIHSKEENKTEDVLKKLETNELDVIVQVRKLGEGFDHKWLSVAAVCSIFANLSPFVQFVGRIMRAIEQNDTESPKNQGIVVYHAGANVAQRWTDFKEFSEADQAYFDDLFPTEEVFDFVSDPLPKEIKPAIPQPLIEIPPVRIIDQTEVTYHEDNLVELTTEQSEVLSQLVEEIGSKEAIIKHLQRLQPRKQEARRAARKALDEEVKNAVGRIAYSKKLNLKGRELDVKYLGRDNSVIIKSMIDKKAAELVGKSTGTRGEWSAEQIDIIRQKLPEIVEEIANKI